MKDNEIKLESFNICGFRSIDRLEDFKPKPLNIMIGPNGSGKSNFILFFNFLSWMLGSVKGKMQERLQQLGGTSDVLFDGPEKTQSLSGNVALRTQSGLNEYKFKLQFAKPDRLYFAEEAYRFSPNNLQEEADWTYLGGGHTEAELLKQKGNTTAKVVRDLLRKMVVYQFHNTTDTASMRRYWNLKDGTWLKSNGQNLGSFLYRVQNDDPEYYLRIVRYVQAVLPFFDEFELEPEYESILLRWSEKGTEKIFNAGQASDGMLRTIALIALLAQNEDDLPAVLFLDEPELGLHPAAIDLLAGLIKTASEYCQIFVATQSPRLVDNFDPEDLIVIERRNRGSTYYRPSNKELKMYMEDFTTEEMWDQNILGGRP